jgi:hypothetical protein
VTTVTLHATGAATPAEAWDRYAVPDRWPEWSPQITGVDVTAERIAQGIAGGCAAAPRWSPGTPRSR